MLPATGKNECVLSSQVSLVAPDLLSSLVKLQAVGRRRVLISSTLGICVRELVRDGPLFWRAMLRKLLVSLLDRRGGLGSDGVTPPHGGDQSSPPFPFRSSFQKKKPEKRSILAPIFR